MNHHQISDLLFRSKSAGYNLGFGGAGASGPRSISDSFSSIHALHSLSACSSASFLVGKIESLGSKRLISNVQFRSVANTSPFGRHIFPGAETAIP